MKCTDLRFAIDHVRIERAPSHEEAADLADLEGVRTPAKWTDRITPHMQVKGKRPISRLIAALSNIGGIHEVGTVGEDSELD